MKRSAYLVLTLVLLLFGCGKEIAGTIPNESETLKSCIMVRSLEAETDFGKFTASVPSGAEAEARRLVESALECYPAGLLEQLGEVEILLAGNLTGESEFAHGSYAGFTQRTEEGWLVVLDAERADIGTVHHEIAHILDGILTEVGALTEEEWMEFCPDGFVYGEGEWAVYADFFVDAYAMTDRKEDRARVFEAAVQGGPGVFDDRPALWLKLEYFSRAIRGYFDTEGWPPKTAWELALE